MAIAENPKPVMPAVKTADFHRKMDHYLQMAQHEPIRITRQGSRHLVILSAERYEQMRLVTQRSYYAHELPESLIEAVKRAEMDPRHAALDELLK